MNNTDKIRVYTFGRFEVYVGDKSINQGVHNSKKTWAFLAYTMLNRDNGITQNDIIDALWSKEIGSPYNSLKTLVYRLRLTMKELGMPYSKEFILSKKNTYFWNKELEYEIDYEIFDDLCKKVFNKKTPKVEAEAMALEAFNLYKGEFLPAMAQENWVINMNRYYQAHYSRIVEFIIECLKERNDYEGIVEICKEAIELDKFQEYFHREIINAYININQVSAARTQYKEVYNLFFNKLGIDLSSKFKDLYLKLMDNERPIEFDLNVIKNELNNDEAQELFVCEYEVFKNIYLLEKRVFERYGQPGFIASITVTDTNHGMLSDKYIANEMQRLLDVLAKTVRKSDVITRYSPTQYLVMLTAQTIEDADSVLKRVINTYKKEAPKKKFDIFYSIKHISDDADEGVEA